MLKHKYQTEVLENNGHRKEIVRVSFDEDHKMLEGFFAAEIRNFKRVILELLQAIDGCERSWLSFDGNRYHMLVSRRAVYIEDNYRDDRGIVIETEELRELIEEYIEKTRK